MTSKHSLLWAAAVFAFAVAVTFGCGSSSTCTSKSDCASGQVCTNGSCVAGTGGGSGGGATGGGSGGGATGGGSGGGATGGGSGGGATGGGSGGGATGGGATGGGATGGGATGGGSGGSATGGGTGTDAGTDAGTGGGGGTDAGTDAGTGCVNLTVKNYLAWCTISVADGGYSTQGSQTVCVPPGTISMALRPASTSFIIGPNPWHDTSGDVDGGEQGALANGASFATKVVGGTRACVWACCPFTSGTGCGGIPDQCP